MMQPTSNLARPNFLAASTPRRVPLELFAREPFRLFFPAATLAGLTGVSLWPLHLHGYFATYPGQLHARIMAHGLFGGFIFGFLGTAMPRMLSAKPLRIFEVLPLLLVYLISVASYATGHMQQGDGAFLLLILGFAVFMGPRIRARKDLPPPGFVLVGLSFLCVATGAVLAILENPDNVYMITLQRLLTYQGFALLPILGIGPFILPRFFGMPSPHDLPESMKASGAWLGKASLAFGAGSLIIASFFLEANGWLRLGYAIRFATAMIYIALEMPWKAAPKSSNAFGLAIRISLIGILSGFLAIVFYPAYRVGLLHLTLIGGFAVITFAVAARVLFGHSGNLAQMKKKNRWFPIALGLMLFGMATRISGDFLPKIMASHYTYGAILWIIGVLIWGVFTLPKVLVADDE